MGANLLMRVAIHKAESTGLEALKVIRIEGVESSGNVYAYTPDRSPACIVLRYASTSCSYCKQDRAFFNLLFRQLRQVGCTAVVLAPTREELEAPSDGEHRLEFTTAATARALPLTATPTTLLFDWAGRVIWLKQGAMDRDDVGRAIRAAAGASQMKEQ
jgi:hypothetical protein